MGETVEVEKGDFRGVWYYCGTQNTYPGNSYVYCGPKATFSVWHRPMAVYSPETDRTYFVFADARNRPVISYYEHAEERFEPPVVLGTNVNMDAHRNPTLQIDEEGYLYVLYGAHGDPSHVVRSASPFDIASWMRRPDITDPSNTYPQPWQLRPGELLVSYRQAPGWLFRRSADGAATWSEPRDLIRFDDAQIYAISIAETGLFPRRLHIAWSRLGGGTPDEVRTKHLWARRYNVYYACSDDGGDTWHRSDGSEYALPITESSAEKVYDCGQRGVWLKDTQILPDGRPLVLFIDSDVTTYESKWKVAVLSQAKWSIADVATSDHMYDAGAVVVLAPDDVRIYGPSTPSQPHKDGGEIEEWRSTDGGLSWKNTRHVTSGSKYSHNHVKTVYNHERSGGGFRVIWSYGDADDPPETADVDMCFYAEDMERPKRVGG